MTSTCSLDLVAQSLRTMLYHDLFEQILYAIVCKNFAFKRSWYCFNCYALANLIYKDSECQASEMLMRGLKMPTVMLPALQNKLTQAIHNTSCIKWMCTRKKNVYFLIQTVHH